MFVAYLVEPADNAFGREHPGSVSALRRGGLAADGSLRVLPPSFIVGPDEEAIPAALVESLPEDGLLNVRWEFATHPSALSGSTAAR